MRIKKSKNERTLFEGYPVQNLDGLCTEVWAIVNDYLIDEIDSNHSLLKDSIAANTITKCIDYICTDEVSARFRSGRSVFSVIIRLFQTDIITTAELEQALINNSKLLLMWFDALIAHGEKGDLENASIKSFYSSFSTAIVKHQSLHSFVDFHKLDDGTTPDETTTNEDNKAIERIKAKLRVQSDLRVRENYDKLIALATQLCGTTSLKDIGTTFLNLAEIEEISPIAGEIVRSEFEPKTPSPGMERLTAMFSKYPPLEDPLDVSEGLHYVVKCQLSRATISLIVSFLDSVPQTTFVTRLLEDFKTITDSKQNPRQSFTLDLGGSELFALHSFLTMMVYLNADIPAPILSELETLIFNDIRNAVKL